jgi:hypothetical protein
MTPQERLARIDAELAADNQLPSLDHLGIPTISVAEAATTSKKYRLLADGDSWFDYPIGRDVLDYLNNYFQHPVTKLAKAGSTLNELVYGPDKLFRSDPSQGKTRLTKVVEKLREQQFDAILFSGGGNDIAGPEFFSFINHAASELPNPNRSVLDGVVHGSFRKAYEDMIEVLLAEAQRQGIHLPIFVHGYDYPWPDGRGAVALGIVGPWFEETFRKKGFPLWAAMVQSSSSAAQLSRNLLSRLTTCSLPCRQSTRGKFSKLIFSAPCPIATTGLMNCIRPTLASRPWLGSSIIAFMRCFRKRARAPRDDDFPLSTSPHSPN